MAWQTCPERLKDHQTSLIPLIIPVHMAQIDMVHNKARYERSQENSTSIYKIRIDTHLFWSPGFLCTAMTQSYLDSFTGHRQKHNQTSNLASRSEADGSAHFLGLYDV